MAISRAVSTCCGIALVVACLAAGCKKGDADAGTLKVGAASSLGPALAELSAAFTAETGTRLVVSPSSSGKLATQIEEGAPYDVFVSASERWVDQVISAEAALPDTKRSVAYGRLAVWSLGGEVELAQLGQPAFARIAIANPEHAPYGRAAKQALESAELWPAVQSRIVYGSNVQQAFQFAETDNADAAVAALSLAISAEGGHYTLVDDSLHAPLAQVAIVTAQSKQPEAARAFIDFLGTEAARGILREHGLLQRGEKLER